MAELEGYPLSEERPGLAAVAVCLAALLDDPKAKAAYPGAARELRNVLDVLTRRAAQRHRKLPAVRLLSGKA